MDFQPTKGIFLQIADNISEKILNDQYPVAGKVPSVRELAAQTGVNPNTIVRSYAELQSRGIIKNQRGIGFFVADQAKERILIWKKEEFFNMILPEFIRQANMLNISIEEIADRLATTN